MKKILAMTLIVVMLMPLLISCDEGLLDKLQGMMPELTIPADTTPADTTPADTTTGDSLNNESNTEKSGDDGDTDDDTPVTTPPTTPTTTTPEVDPNRIPPEVKNFGGYEYKFVTDHQTDYELQVPEQIGGIGLNKALVERNKKVEALYNVKITEARNPNGDTDGYAFLDSASASGAYFGDIYSNYALKMVYTHSIAGFYLNLGHLSSLRLGQEWWDQEYMNEMTINGHVYTMTGDIQTNDDLHEIMLSMNLTLYNRAYPEKNFYDILITNKAWTFDEFYRTWNNFESKDYDTAGKVDSDDMVGYYYDCRTASYMYMASDMNLFTMQNNKPVLTVSSDKAIKVVEYLQKILDGSSNLKTARIDNQATGGGYEASNNHFAASKALFISHSFIDALQYQQNMTDTVVHVPFPKYTQTQGRHYSLVHMCFEPIAISANVEDPERTALITEALAFYSDALDEEIEKLLLDNSSNEQARKILQLTLDSKGYDFEYIANVMQWTSLVNDTLMCNNRLAEYHSQMTSLSKRSVKGTGGGTLEKFLAAYAELNFRK